MHSNVHKPLKEIDSHTFTFLHLSVKTSKAHCAASEGHVHTFELILQLNCDSTKNIEIYKENIFLKLSIIMLGKWLIYFG